MTGPKETKGYKSKSGNIWPTWEDAVMHDMCIMITEYADQKGGGGKALGMFHAGETIKKMNLDPESRRMFRVIAGALVEHEGQIVLHWIFNNLDLLESLIAYYLDCKKEKEKLFKEGLK